MTKQVTAQAELIVPLDVSMTGMATRFAEEAGKAAGLAQRQQMKLAVAVEELFVFLASDGREGETAKLVSVNGNYYVKFACMFPLRSLPTALFNITARMEYDDENALDQLGLFLASRAVDRFELVKNELALEIRLIVEKEYPLLTTSGEALFVGSYHLADGAGVQEWKQLALQTYARYGVLAPAFMQYPGKVADMIGSGDYDVVVATDGKGNVAGGVMWEKTAKMAVMHGPYIFCRDKELVRDLLDAALVKMARGQTICLVNIEPVEVMPSGYFDVLGILTSDGPECQRAVLYRQLAEDQGTAAYTLDCLHQFLQETYTRLALPRHIQLVHQAGERQAESSALSTVIDWELRQASLAILAPGGNIKENLNNHVTFLREQGISRILFQLDLGQAAEALLGQEILAAGFEPRLVLPWGGTGDILLFRFREAG